MIFNEILMYIKRPILYFIIYLNVVITLMYFLYIVIATFTIEVTFASNITLSSVFYTLHQYEANSELIY